MSAVYRRGVEAEILADNPPHSVQLPNRHPRQMAWKPLSVRPALSIRSARDLGRRIRRPVHSLGLDKPRPLRSTMASTHGNLVLPPSRPVAEGGTEDHRSRRAIAPPIASRLSESAFASGPPKVSSPRCSPGAYGELTGDFGNKPEAILIGDHGLSCLLAEKLSLRDLRLLQQYLSIGDIARLARNE